MTLGKQTRSKRDMIYCNTGATRNSTLTVTSVIYSFQASLNK